jgi:hypothetical protein
VAIFRFKFDDPGRWRAAAGVIYSQVISMT